MASQAPRTKGNGWMARWMDEKNNFSFLMIKYNMLTC